MGLHTIFGLPGESDAEQLAVADALNALPMVQFVKLHHLYISKGSIMGVRYARKPWPLYSLEEYGDFLCRFLPRLRPNLVVQRLFGVSDKEFHLAPNWGLKKQEVQSQLENLFRARGVVQGSALSETHTPVFEAVPLQPH